MVQCWVLHNAVLGFSTVQSWELELVSIVQSWDSVTTEHVQTVSTTQCSTGNLNCAKQYWVLEELVVSKVQSWDCTLQY